MDINFNYIFAELQSRFSSGMTIFMEKGRSLGQTDFITLLAVTILGALMCFFGLKLVRFLAAILGLLVGISGGTYLAVYFGLEGYVPLIIGIVAGLVLAILGARIYRVGVFWVGWMLGIAGSAYIIQPKNWKFLLISVGIGLLIGLITLKLAEPVTMLITALFGGYVAGQAAYILLPFHKGSIRTALLAVFIILGIIIQFLQESKKRKKQHLRKAEEIRNIHSTANEVDRARAMMEDLDGQEHGEDSTEKQKESAAPEVEADVLDLDNIADYDEELDEDE